MHGRVQPEGQRNRCLRRTSSQHMQSALPLVTTEDTVAVQGDHQSSVSSITTITVESFLKNGRKVSIGDCALFKPPQDSPPFIGIIRSLTSSKDNNLTLGVNWLYRPAEIKLSKGIVVEGAPNEIFYSFHKDEAPAASLLHPCKVAFLPRGVELPAGTSSFVCRRVYDIANKCLWWLTDQDYINGRQEEVDQLLYKTSVEMHATLHSSGRSPKQVNGPTSTSQLKAASESVQNSAATLHSQIKGKKRERGDHGSDSVKRERILRSDDGDSFLGRTDSNLKSEITRITEKGGLIDLEAVEKLVQLMLPDRSEKKMDLVNRSMLAGVMAATDKVDCLNRFVQLRGLPVLDEWLQDIQKGKIGDGNSLKDSDKSVEEFLLILLRALDKLPVNLNSLQTCNIGKSVNHLRSHKNIEIQRKARSLVDTWKKRVEAEMISIDAISRLPDSSQSVSRTPSGSDVAMKSSVTQNSASKTTSARSSHGESNLKSATASPGHVKSAASSPSSGKESHPRIPVVGTPDAPLIREDRSSSSNQSQNHAQSSGKEDGKSNVAGLVSVNKMSSSITRNRKISGFPGSTVTGNAKENSSGRNSSVHRVTTLEKSHSSSEKALEEPITGGGSHKLIVKIPNRVRSPAAQGLVGGPMEDSTCMSSRVSSPALSDKHGHFDRASEDKGETNRCPVSSDMNADSWQNDDPKGVLTGSADGAAESPAVLPGDEKSMNNEDSRRSVDDSANQLKSGKLHESSFSPMNALIESCVKYSEANSSFAMDDDVGMKLLASVATGEMSKSDLGAPGDSTERSTPTVPEVCQGDEARSKSSPENNITGAVTLFNDAAETDDKKQVVLDGGSWPEDGLPKQATLELSGDKKFTLLNKTEVLAGEGDKHFNSSSTDVKDKAVPKWDTGVNSKEKSCTTSSTLPTIPTEKAQDDDTVKEIPEGNGTSGNACSDCITNPKSGDDVMKTEENANADSVGQDMSIVGDKAVDKSSQGNLKKKTNGGLDTGNVQGNLNSKNIKSEIIESTSSEKMQLTACTRNLVLEARNMDKVEGPDEKDAKSCLEKTDRLNFHMEVEGNMTDEIHNTDSLCSAPHEPKNHHETNVESKENMEQFSVPERTYPNSMENESFRKNKLNGSRSAENQTEEANEHTSTWDEASFSSARVSDTDAKIKFDLNEGFSADEGKYGEPANLTSSDATSLRFVNSIPFSVSSALSSHTASITFAAAAKGPFVPPEDLLRSKNELGWKGSAATSAFRPAEPRKVLEIPLGSINISCPDASTSKQGRIPLDIDLNVPDEKVLEEMGCRDTFFAVDSMEKFASNHDVLQNEAPGSLSGRSSGGLDLDLNRVDEASESANCSTSGSHKGEGSTMRAKPFMGFPTGDLRRGFDLNDGPGADDGVEPFPINQQVKGAIPPQLSSLGLRVNGPSPGGLSSWFPPGNTYSSIAIPSMLPDRGEHSFPVFPASAPPRTFSPSGVTTFTPDLLRGSVLSSSPAVPFQSNPFQFPVFPFGSTFPLPSATFPVGATSYVDSSPRMFPPSVHSQYLGSVGSVASQFHRPYVVGLPDSSNSGLEISRKWAKQGLDLNAGPAGVESEAREEMFPLASGQHTVASAQAYAEEQARMYSVTSGIRKRKDPEGGWENDSYRFEQSSWR